LTFYVLGVIIEICKGILILNENWHVTLKLRLDGYNIMFVMIFHMAVSFIVLWSAKLQLCLLFIVLAFKV
jgi:hypothetical protein